ncbi:MAG: PHP domain-containing protein [Candidatus Gracilibacteria bacterium]|nr:PHP domain-containing protein [Candidatus Gracilibacteria bacterium]
MKTPHIADLHFHSTLSDGRKTPEEIVELARGQGIGMAVCTDHDRINGVFTALAREHHIESVDGVEASIMSEGKQIHLATYSNHFSEATRKILDNTRGGRIKKILSQIEALESNGFIISSDDFLDHYMIQGISPRQLNITNLAEFIWKNSRNRETAENFLGKDVTQQSFLKQCLWKEGDMHWVATPDVKKSIYVPTVRKYIETLDLDAIISLAHPNFTFHDTHTFREQIGRLVDQGVNAVELNALADKTWVHAILHVKHEYNLILTMGSDSHFKREADKKHALFGTINPYLDDNQVGEIVKTFGKRVGIL